MKKDNISLRNRIAKLEARNAAACKGFERALDPAAHERQAALRSKIQSIKPGSPWTEELEREYQERLSLLPPPPPLTDYDRRLMALPYFQTSSTEELVAALMLRLSGVVPTRYGRQTTIEPLAPPPRRTAECTEEEPTQVPQPASPRSRSPTPVRRDYEQDKLKDYRGDPTSFLFFESNG
jgi:hypothetical protein